MVSPTTCANFTRVFCPPTRRTSSGSSNNARNSVSTTKESCNSTSFLGRSLSDRQREENRSVSAANPWPRHISLNRTENHDRRSKLLAFLRRRRLNSKTKASLKRFPRRSRKKRNTGSRQGSIKIVPKNSTRITLSESEWANSVHPYVRRLYVGWRLRRRGSLGSIVESRPSSSEGLVAEKDEEDLGWVDWDYVEGESEFDLPPRPESALDGVYSLPQMPVREPPPPPPKDEVEVPLPAPPLRRNGQTFDMAKKEIKKSSLLPAILEEVEAPEELAASPPQQEEEELCQFSSSRVHRKGQQYKAAKQQYKENVLPTISEEEELWEEFMARGSARETRRSKQQRVMKYGIEIMPVIEEEEDDDDDDERTEEAKLLDKFRSMMLPMDEPKPQGSTGKVRDLVKNMERSVASSPVHENGDWKKIGIRLVEKEVPFEDPAPTATSPDWKKIGIRMVTEEDQVS